MTPLTDDPSLWAPWLSPYHSTAGLGPGEEDFSRVSVSFGCAPQHRGKQRVAGWAL